VTLPSDSRPLYDRLGPRYRSAGFASWAVELRPRLLELLALPPDPPPGRWIDLGCGSGELLAIGLPGRDAKVGLDLSLGMLAAGRACRGSLLTGDARRLPLRSDFASLATATFDVANHMLDSGALEEFFRETARILVPGGIFLFDANSPHHLRLWDGTSQRGEGEERIDRVGRFDESHGVALVRFERIGADGTGELLGLLRERGWTPGPVESLLRRCGFEVVRRLELRAARGASLRHLWRADRR
jgi:SAM-dependent methyltransferase